MVKEEANPFLSMLPKQPRWLRKGTSLYNPADRRSTSYVQTERTVKSSSDSSTGRTVTKGNAGHTASLYRPPERRSTSSAQTERVLKASIDIKVAKADHENMTAD